MGTKETDGKKTKKVHLPFIGKFKCRKKANRKLGKEATLGGFICFLLMGMAVAFPIYYIVTEWGDWPKGSDTMCFLLYIGIFSGAGIWLLCCLVYGNVNAETVQIMIQPFVLIVTFWGYILDIFGDRKELIIAIATVVLIISLVVSLKADIERQKKKTVDVTIEKTSTVYEVILIDEKGTENHYRVTVRK